MYKNNKFITNNLIDYIIEINHLIFWFFLFHQLFFSNISFFISKYHKSMKNINHNFIINLWFKFSIFSYQTNQWKIKMVFFNQNLLLNSFVGLKINKRKVKNTKKRGEYANYISNQWLWKITKILIYEFEVMLENSLLTVYFYLFIDMFSKTYS